MNTQPHTYHRTLLIAFVLVGALALFLGAPAQAAPPDNDDFDDATVITSLPYTVVQEVREATAAGDDPVCHSNQASVWFAYTPAEEQLLLAYTFGSDYDTTLGVYTGERGSLAEIACNDDVASLSSAVTFTAQAGVTYYFQVGSYHGGSFSRALHFHLEEAVPPPNDDFDDATPITTLPFTTSDEVGSATVGFDDPDCFGVVPSVWFAFTPAEDVTVAADTLASSYDTTLCVFTGERGNLTLLASNDEAMSTSRSYVAFDAQGGETYTILVGTWESHGLAYLTLRLQEIEPLPANDDFDSATDTSPLPFASFIHNSGLTMADDDPRDCVEPALGTAWFAFTPQEEMTVEARAIGGSLPWLFGPVALAQQPDATEALTLPGIIGVYTGERGDLQPVACAIERLRLEVEGGETYYFMISSVGVSELPFAKVLFTLKEAAPVAPNDDFDDATVIKSLIFTDRTYTGQATKGADDPSLAGCGSTVWYSYTPERSNWVSMDTAGSDYDTILGLFTGERGALNRLAANDDNGESRQARLVYFLEGGESYYLVVCAYMGETPYDLQLRVAPIPTIYLPLLNRVGLNAN